MNVRSLLSTLLLVALACLPLLSLVGSSGTYLADPLSELPVKLWCFETFAHHGLLGATIDATRFPSPGPLNNPDVVGTVVTALLRPILGRPGAWDALVVLQLLATMLAGRALAREFVEDETAATLGGVAFALTPIVLVYPVAGAVSDMLNLWPYALVARHLVRAARGEKPAWNGALAGLFVSIGFVTCPYDVVVFACALVPGAFALPTVWRGVGSDRAAARRLVVTTVAAVVSTVVFAGGDVVSMRHMMSAPDSQMSASAVADTRHSPPWTYLRPSHESRYVAYLSDYVAVGKSALIERSAASRYYRAFSPGFFVIGLTALACVASKRRFAARMWAAVAIFAALASTGPFLPITRTVQLATPSNPAFLLLHYGMPGASLLLEPFRYAIVVAFALAMGAAMGVEVLIARVGGWVAWAAPIAHVAEVALLSPVPIPLPTATLPIPAIFERIDQVLGPGALLELPYFDHGSARFNRVHFLHQLVHGRPIADEVMGFPPRFLTENQFTASLLHVERWSGPLSVDVTDPTRIDADRAALATAGFAGIVLLPDAYQDAGRLAEVRRQLEPFGAPVYEGADAIVYAVR